MEAQPGNLLFIPRWPYQWLAMIMPTALCGVSWFSGGLPGLTDIGFSLLTLVCVIFLAGELVRFPRRFGIGGILLYGGVLIWFCQDYFTNWFGVNFALAATYPAVTIAKVAFFHCLFIMMMMIGLEIKSGRWLPKLILKVPEPGSETFYIVLILVMEVIGLSGFLFAQESFLTTLENGAFGVWLGTQINWSVGRSGNVNYNWGAYVAQVLQVGQVGAIFASLFAIVISTKLWSKVLCWCVWIFWTLNVYSGARRGELAMMVLPPIGILFIKYQSRVAMGMRAQSILAYVVGGVLSLGLLFAVQLEGSFRGQGLINADLSQVELTKLQGNSMFSEGLGAWQMIPDQHGFFNNRFFGEGFIRPIPEQLMWFFISGVPRALWTSKPIDESWEWYNSAVTGNYNGTEGTTVSHGLVGSWYIKYGLGGIIEGGLLVGWLMGVCERVLQNSNGRPVGMFLSLGMAVWLFRLYRDYAYTDLYQLLVGATAMAGLIWLGKPFFGTIPREDTELAQGQAEFGASYSH